MSWISLVDLTSIIQLILTHEAITTPVNAVSPHPVTNKEFTRMLGSVLGRPTLVPAPAWGLRFLLGEMAESLLLAGARVHPQRLLEGAFQFKYPDLPTAFRAAI